MTDTNLKEFRGCLLHQDDIEALLRLDADVNTLITRKTEEIQIQRIEMGTNEFYGFIVKDNSVFGILINFEQLRQAPLAAFSFPRLKILDFGLMPVERIPDEIANLTTLEELDVPSYNLKAISPNIGLLKNLKILYIQCNIPMKEGRYIELPDSIGNLEKLEELVLSGLRMHTLPKGMKNLVKLRRLDLDRCELESLPEDLFENMKHLAIFNFFSKKIKKLPDSIFNCRKLIALDLLEENSNFPHTIGEMVDLEVLYVRSPLITTFPPEILQLKHLKKLHFSGKVSTIPTEIGNLENLEELVLTGNSVEDLPETLGNLKKLLTLNVNNTAIRKLPDSITQLAGLITLRAISCRLAVLPDNMGSMQCLEVLAVANNQLTSLPPSLGSCPHLENLFIAGNPIQEIPESIRQIPEITIDVLKDAVKAKKKEKRTLGKGQWTFALCTTDVDFIPTRQDLEKTLELLHTHKILPLDPKSPQIKSTDKANPKIANNLKQAAVQLQQIIQNYSEESLVKEETIHLMYPVKKKHFLELVKQADIPYVDWGLMDEASLVISKEEYPRTMSGPESTYDSRFVVFQYDFGNGHWEPKEYEKLETLLKQYLHDFINDFENLIGKKLKTVWDWAD